MLLTNEPRFTIRTRRSPDHSWETRGPLSTPYADSMRAFLLRIGWEVEDLPDLPDGARTILPDKRQTAHANRLRSGVGARVGSAWEARCVQHARNYAERAGVEFLRQRDARNRLREIGGSLLGECDPDGMLIDGDSGILFECKFSSAEGQIHIPIPSNQWNTYARWARRPGCRSIFLIATLDAAWMIDSRLLPVSMSGDISGRSVDFAMSGREVSREDWTKWL